MAEKNIVADGAEMEEIELEVSGTANGDVSQVLQFTGRLLASDLDSSIYLTEGGQIVRWTDFGGCGEGHAVFPSLDALQEEEGENLGQLIAEAFEAVGRQSVIEIA